MTFANGVAKGLKVVLEERGVEMKAPYIARNRRKSSNSNSSTS